LIISTNLPNCHSEVTQYPKNLARKSYRRISASNQFRFSVGSGIVPDRQNAVPEKSLGYLQKGELLLRVAYFIVIPDLIGDPVTKTMPVSLLAPLSPKLAVEILVASASGGSLPVGVLLSEAHVMMVSCHCERSEAISGKGGSRLSS
jgi:hypothetical protein